MAQASLTASHMRCVRLTQALRPLPSSRARRVAPAAAKMAPQGSATGLDHDEYHAKWENMWGKGLKPGEAFDATKPSPALTHLLSSGGLAVDGKKVFVPGCGRGYDLVEFARRGAAAAVGLELAPSAQKEAAAYLEGELRGEEAARAAVHAGDFFRWQHEEHAAYDVGYDYTFMCALHPEMRGDWAAAWARHLAPGGQLVCLAFPIDQERKGVQGPPWFVEPQHYKDHLHPHGFALEREEAVPAERSHPGRGGKEALLVFRKAH